MKTLVFAGSTRQHSFNRQLAHASATMARASWTICVTGRENSAPRV